MLTIESVKKLVPKGQRTLITEEFIDKLEGMVKDPMIADAFKDNFITYLGVLNQGKYKMEDYINAVMYVSYKLLGKTNIDAYAATFPKRFQRLKDEGQTQIDAFCSMYNKNKLVMQIYEQTLVPSYVLNAPLYQEALNTLARVIKANDTTPMVRVKACEAILVHTKPPEIIKNEFVFGMEQQSTISDLREVTENLADMYKLALENGHKSLKDIAKSKIIDVTPEEDEEESKEWEI